MAQQRVIPSSNTTGKRPKTSKDQKERLSEIRATAFFKKLFTDMFSEYRRVASHYRSGWSRHTPHQGEQEKARRMRQIELGIIRVAA